MRSRLMQIAVAAFAVLFAATSCTDDEKQPEEVVEPSAGEEPVEPPPPADEGATGDFSPEIIYFAFDDYTLSMDAQDKLSRLADFMKNGQTASVQVEGHCDERGSIEYNLALGERRSQSVKNYLVRMGVDPSRLTTISYGEERPVSEGHDESAWSQNRRAEFIVSGN